MYTKIFPKSLLYYLLVLHQSFHWLRHFIRKLEQNIITWDITPNLSLLSLFFCRVGCRVFRVLHCLLYQTLGCRVLRQGIIFCLKAYCQLFNTHGFYRESNKQTNYSILFYAGLRYSVLFLQIGIFKHTLICGF